MDKKVFDKSINGGGRDTSLDSLKFILIFLVALCHSIEPFRYGHYSVAAFYSVVYAFHMPLFVMLSGYFSKHVTLKKLKHGAPKLLESYIIMCIVTMIFIGNKYELKAPMLSEWYLLSLVFWRICAAFINKLKLRKALVIPMSFVGAFAAFILLGKHSYALSSMRTMLFLPYFIIGYFLPTESIQSLRKNKKVVICIALPFVIALMVGSYFYPRAIHVMEFNSDGISILSQLCGQNYLIALVGKFVFYLCGIALCFSALTVEVRYQRIAKLGCCTLFLYCMQLYFIQVPEKMGLLTSIWQSIFLTIFVFIVSCSLAKFKVVQDFTTNPLSTLVNKIIKS